MLKDVFFLVSRDLGHMLRRRETLLWTFVMPVIFFYFIGSISGGFGRSGDADPIAVVKPAGAGFLADQLIARLQQRNFRLVQQPDYFRQLRIPADFTDAMLAGRPAKVEFVRSGSGINADYETTRLNRAVYSLASDVALLGAKASRPRLSRWPHWLRSRAGSRFESARRARAKWRRSGSNKLFQACSSCLPCWFC